MPIDDDTIVVPVPDTSKAAADAMAYKLGVPCVEGLIRNRYAGRTFIEGGAGRKHKAETKYTPLREVLEGKRVLLVEDSIVRSTTMRVLLNRDSRAGPGHARFTSASPARRSSRRASTASTCPRSSELFAPKFLQEHGRGRELTDEVQAEMARRSGPTRCAICRSSRSPAPSSFDRDQLCQACITGDYPTPQGQELYQIALEDHLGGQAPERRTYERVEVCSR